jgi:23S rRNA (adenine2503-C2)-methyltransferase
MEIIRNSIIYDYDFDEISQKVVDFGEKKYRARQIFDAIFPCGVNSPYDIKNIPQRLQKKLDEEFEFIPADIVKTLVSPLDNSVKFALRLLDGCIIECVILYSKERRTLCLSSQVGCALGCAFCQTGKIGFKRNLSSGEILYQAVVASDYLKKYGERITNVVFMGMGEALSNFDNFYKAYDALVDKKILGIGTHKITVSTAGVIPSIKKLIDKKIQIDLAVSLNASDDSLRSKIMPVNEKYPIARLIEAAKEYAENSGRTVMFEYVMIAEKNDTDLNAKQLVGLLKNVSCKLNVIALNDCGGNFSCSCEERIDGFTKIIHDAGIRVTVRRSGGRDIGGACGQLAGESQ